MLTVALGAMTASLLVSPSPRNLPSTLTMSFLRYLPLGTLRASVTRLPSPPSMPRAPSTCRPLPASMWSMTVPSRMRRTSSSDSSTEYLL